MRLGSVTYTLEHLKWPRKCIIGTSRSQFNHPKFPPENMSTAWKLSPCFTVGRIPDALHSQAGIWACSSDYASFPGSRTLSLTLLNVLISRASRGRYSSFNNLSSSLETAKSPKSEVPKYKMVAPRCMARTTLCKPGFIRVIPWRSRAADSVCRYWRLLLFGWVCFLSTALETH